MILVDASVWVDHLRRGDAALEAALDANVVAMHPFVIGELACGLLKSRRTVLGLLRSLARLAAATDEEVLDFLTRYRLMGPGLGNIGVSSSPPQRRATLGCGRASGTTTKPA
jgi:predicted nucleic acid-binding protein